VLLRRMKGDAEIADKKSKTVLLVKSEINRAAATMSNTVPNTVRKPSERFMRKPLQARSRASNSERIRVADLVNGLEKKANTEVTNNGEQKFKGYRPGHEGPTG
jgi:hypothetical protein